MITKNLQKALFLTLVIVVGIAIYAAQTYLLSATQNSSSSNQELHCDFNNLICEMRYQGVSLVGVFDTKPQVEEMITLQIKGIIESEIDSGWIEGVNMYMGRIPLVFEKTEQGSWTTWFVLGQCSQPDMEWRIVINIKGQKNPALLYFTTDTM